MPKFASVVVVFIGRSSFREFGKLALTLYSAKGFHRNPSAKVRKILYVIHHVTLTMIAFGFLVAEGFRRKKTGRLDVTSSQTGAAEYSAPVSGLLSDL